MLFSLRMELFISFMLVLFLYTTQSLALNFNTDISVSWGEWHVEISSNGEEMQLQMDQSSGSGAETNAEFLFGKFDMHVKLNRPDSSGTITTFYVISLFLYDD
jgi:Glycosyl hydrolases family 16